MFVIIAFVLWFVAVLGWGMNVIQVIMMALNDSPFGTLFFLKLIGLPLAPIGAVMGWLPY